MRNRIPEQTTLLSYPRSGVSWLRYIVRNLIGLPDIDAHKADDTSSLVRKTHWINSEAEITGKLIVIVRNYKEAIVRHNKDHPDNDDNFKFSHSLDIKPTIEPAVSYIHPLYMYESWDNDKKLLIYYEDLVNDDLSVQIDWQAWCPAYSSIYAICNFLTLPNFRAWDFVQDYEHHKERSIKLYTNEDNKPETKGKESVYHSNRLTDIQKLEWDATISFMYPSIYDKYLTRYAESNK